MQWDLIWNDTRLSWRSVLRHPAFTTLIVVTLALGIGINTTVFALLDGVLLRPLSYRDPSRLVFVWQTLPSHDVFELEPTPFDYAAWRAVRSFESVALVSTDAFTLSGEDNPERVRGARVTASLMPLLGIHPQIGRAFATDEDSDTAAPVVILSDGLWKRRYAADPGVVGRDIRINGVGHTVIGVMAPHTVLPAHLAASSELWLAARMSPAELANAIRHDYTVLARLASNVSFTSASNEIGAFAKRMAAEHPESHTNLGARLTSVEELTVRSVRPALLVVSGGVALLLLVACANAATLLVARAVNREHETAVRTALGATGGRLLSLAVIESITYSMLGGAAGVAIAVWTLGSLLPHFAATLPPAATIGVNARVVLITGVLSALLGLLLGFVVASHRPARLVDALKKSSRTTAGGSVARTRGILVVVQIALAVILLSAAGLMVNSVAKLSRVSAGFDAERVLSFRLALTNGPYDFPVQRAAFVRDLTHRLSSLPGVTAAAVTSAIPFGGTRGANGVAIEGRPSVRGETIIIDQRHVSPSYFAAMQIPVLDGRSLLPSDDEKSEAVVVINKTMARKYFPGERAIDRRVRITAGFGAGEWLRIVGIVDDVRHISLSREFVPEMYRPYAQAAVPTFTVVIHTTGDPVAAAPAAREVVRGLDPGMPLFDVRSMADRVASSFAQTRGTMLVLMVTAMLAAALAAVAVYGSIWYAVSQRIPEIGIRLALGASRSSVCIDVIGRALATTVVGAAIGTTAAIAAGPLLRALLFETKPTDPRTYALVIAGVLGVTALASLVPARRAMSVDPMTALRNE